MAWKVLSVKVQKIPQRAAKAVVRTTAVLRLYALDAQAEISKYPAEGESNYQRTGILGQKWTVSGPKLRGPDLFAGVGNNADYASRVQGSEQEELFAERGWPNINDTNKVVWARHRPLLVLAIKG